MRIGILGGTFDPIHRGHLDIARAAKNQFRLDRILFIPALVPPHKRSQRDLTPAPYRFDMVREAVKGEDGFEVSDIELNRAEVSYTVETLRELKKRHAGDQFFLIVGQDAFADMPAWKEPQALTDLATLLIAPRSGSPPRQLPPNAQPIEMPKIEISSSEIRRLYQEGRPIPPKILPEAVAHYIQKRQLYLPHPKCQS